MRKMKTVVRQVEKEVIEEIRCDLCDRPANGGDWESSLFEVDEVEIEMRVRHKMGMEYPGAGSGQETTIDLCPQCFDERLVPWLRSQGANIEVKEWDY